MKLVNSRNLEVFQLGRQKQVFVVVCSPHTAYLQNLSCPSIPETVALVFHFLYAKEICIRVAKLECYVNLNIKICISKLTKCGIFLQNSEFI